MTERRPGRPRDAAVERAVVEATLAVVREVGFAGFTVDAVAARAGVSKATIYRRWRHKEQLGLDAAATLVREYRAPDTCSVPDDLVAVGVALVRFTKGTAAEWLVPELVAAAARDPEVRRLLRDLSAARRRTMLAIVERAVARGELPPGTDPDTVVDGVAGPLFYRLFMTGAPVDDAVVARVVDTVLDGVR